jgi:hypothetical protein
MDESGAVEGQSIAGRAADELHIVDCPVHGGDEPFFGIRKSIGEEERKGASGQAALLGTCQLQSHLADNRMRALDALTESVDDVAQHAKTALREGDEHQPALHHAGRRNLAGGAAAGHGHAGKRPAKCLVEASGMVIDGEKCDDMLDRVAAERRLDLGNGR